MSKREAGRIENWVYEPHDEWVVGNIYGDERFADGAFIHTSRVVSFDKDHTTVETKNSVFKLGKPLV